MLRVRSWSLVTGFVLLALVVATSALLVELQQSGDETVRHSLIVKNRLGEVLSVIQDAETGRRGYLLTGQREYLAPYEDAVARLGPALMELGDVTKANPVHREGFAKLRVLIDEKMGELRKTIGERESGNAVGALAVVHGDSGESLLKQIRKLVGAMDREETTLLDKHLRDARRMANLLRIGILLAAVIIAGLAVYASLALFIGLAAIFAAPLAVAAGLIAAVVCTRIAIVRASPASSGHRLKFASDQAI